MVPAVYNYDSIGYNPSVLSAEEANTWTAIFDKKWKGKSGLNTDPLIALGQAVMAMNTLGLSDVKNPGNASKKQIEEAMKFLISKKKEGQFRALWGDFGELVNLMASGEMVVCDAWQPAVMAVKAQGKPAQIRRSEGGLSRLVDRAVADRRLAQQGGGLRLCRLLAVRPARHHRVGTGLLFALDQYQERHAGRQIRLLV